jgi:acetoacetyl-CoA reductase
MGVTVVANYAGNEDKAKAFETETGIRTRKWDVGDFDACQAAFAQISEEVGPVDILVNNAGITRDATLVRMTYEMWDEVMRVNLGGCFNMAKATFIGMKSRGFGRIVNIGSINGQGGQYGQVNYAAAKSGIHGFTKALAQEGAKFGVTVNALAPGYIDTDMVAAVPADVTRICSSRRARQPCSPHPPARLHRHRVLAPPLPTLWPTAHLPARPLASMYVD